MDTLAPVVILPARELTPEQYDLAGRVERVLRTRPAEKVWTREQIAARLRVDAESLRPVLRWLASKLLVRTYGGGERERYGRWVSAR